MHHRLLLGSTALVSAGILFANATPAEAQGIEVTLGGYTEFGAKGATDDTLQNGDGDRGYTFYMDNEVHVQATGVSDRGLTYGSYVELELNSGDEDDGNAEVDEVNLFFSGGFGRIELGRNDGAEDLMLVGGEDAQAGTGGVDGDTANLASVIDLNLGDVTKATYFTPRIGGFQLGASYTPETDDDGGRDGEETDTIDTIIVDGEEVDVASTTSFDNGHYNVVSGGINWVGPFTGGIDLTLSAVGVYGDSEGDEDDRKDYAVGALIGIGGLSFGATWGQKTDFNEADWAHLGLEYSFGNAGASIGYTYADVDNFDDTQHVAVVSGNVGLAPGLVLKGDLSYNTEDPNSGDGDEGQDDTIAGVVSVQMDY
jgi:outer membrane protein OmpU